MNQRGNLSRTAGRAATLVRFALLGPSAALLAACSGSDGAVAIEQDVVVVDGVAIADVPAGVDASPDGQGSGKDTQLPDAAGADWLAADANVVPGSIGAPCHHDFDCPAGTCLTGAPFTNGYCTKVIAECPAPGGTDNVCPGGSACVAAVVSGTGANMKVGDYCLKLCAMPADCRTVDGYTCCKSGQFQGKSYCSSGCQ